MNGDEIMTIKNIPNFKIFIIIILFGFLFMYYIQMEIGRYQAFNGEQLLDTKTGEVYRIEGSSMPLYWRKMVLGMDKKRN